MKRREKKILDVLSSRVIPYCKRALAHPHTLHCHVIIALCPKKMKNKSSSTFIVARRRRKTQTTTKIIIIIIITIIKGTEKPFVETVQTPISVPDALRRRDSFFSFSSVLFFISRRYAQHTLAFVF